MVRKIIATLCCTLVICFAIGNSSRAATHTVYNEGTLNSTYTTYFKDILSGVGFNDNYVAFRSGQYTYTMVVGDLDYNNGVITLNSSGKEYVFTTSSGYNSQQTYEVNDITSFSLSTGNYILYSDVGEFPQLMERGAKYEMLSVFMLFVFMLCIIINRIFFKR